MLNKLYTRSEFKYDGMFRHPSGWSVAGIGPTRLCTDPEKKSKVTEAMLRGTDFHKKLEHKQYDCPATKAMAAYMEANFSEGLSEVLLYGKWEGIDIVAWADYVCYTKQGNLAIIDYKTSVKPRSLYERNNHWYAQLALEVFLLHQMHSVLAEPYLLVINPGQTEVISLPVDVASGLGWLKQTAKRYGHLS